MCEYEIEYADRYGYHAEAVEAWDNENAVHVWAENHSGQRVHLLDVTPLGRVEELEVCA